MKLFRELTHDDPFRRQTRSSGASPAKDDGDLFTLRPSPRKLRILTDCESLAEPLSYFDSHLSAFYAYDNIEHLSIRMSECGNPSSPLDRSERGFVQVRDVTAHKGDFAYPGQQYAWQTKDPQRKFDGSSVEERYGNVSPGRQLAESLTAFRDGEVQKPGLRQEDIERAVLLSEIGRSMGFDLIISESATVGIDSLPANDRANVVTRTEALPIVAHYMRTQQQYITNAVSRMVMSRKDYYAASVRALAEGTSWWQGKCQLAPITDIMLGNRFLADAESLIDRMSRALRSRDNLFASISAIQTEDVRDDGADALDHALVCLCGAVDVVARSIHAARRLGGNERNAKLHHGTGYKALMSAYTSAAGREVLDEQQKHLDVVFRLRNTIHSRALSAIASLRTDRQGFPTLGIGRLDVVIPHEAAESMRDPATGGLAFWGAREIGSQSLVVADLPHLLDQCFHAVFSFLDNLCRIVSANAIMDEDPVLKIDVTGVEPSYFDCQRELRTYIGLPSAADPLDTAEAP
ncbi:hypothetical protein HG717_32375 [Rhodococcus erythropolis]|uniref:hypothetical protein n=1 Tax=Rhodococcus erythropolis TaxID=1833 RepID=UPI001C9B9A96|nr:hypothetical protein [Rhodococcus erythropolis]MBY6388580.1 hypothetical protein [Rhodococcus erythropolis]